jgi:hypothetical protein
MPLLRDFATKRERIAYLRRVLDKIEECRMRDRRLPHSCDAEDGMFCVADGYSKNSAEREILYIELREED